MLFVPPPLQSQPLPRCRRAVFFSCPSPLKFLPSSRLPQTSPLAPRHTHSSPLPHPFPSLPRDLKSPPRHYSSRTSPPSPVRVASLTAKTQDTHAVSPTLVSEKSQRPDPAISFPANFSPRLSEHAAQMVQSAILGFPRMGANRDLKKATEACQSSHSPGPARHRLVPSCWWLTGAHRLGWQVKPSRASGRG